MQQLTLDQHFARHFRLEGGALCARLGPLPIAAALDGLSRQSQLSAPAKFALSQKGSAELQTEIPLLAERRLCEKLADAALDAALLMTQADDMPLDEGELAIGPSEVEGALVELPWGFRQTDANRYQIDAAPAVDHAMRVSLVGTANNLRASTRTSLRSNSQEAYLALRYFALESNARLRLARISVAEREDGASIVWDAAVPSQLPAAGAVPAIVEAVVYAQMLTRRSFSALSDARVAAAYLRERPAAMGFAEQSPNARQPTRRTSQWTLQSQKIS